MRKNILVGGKAGDGIDALADLLCLLLVKKGLYVFKYRDYQSLIRGGHNFNIICISDEPIQSYDNEPDLVVAFDENTITQHRKEMKKECIIVTSDEKVEGIHVDVKDLRRAGNVGLASAVAQILGFSKKEVLDVIKERFKAKYFEINEKAVEKCYQDYGKRIELPKGKNKNTMMTGNEAVTEGAIDSGIEVYFGYPMTPSTGVLTQLALKQDHSILAFTYENEIACANAAIGASFAGKKTMTGTAGGGFDLMSEAMSLQGCTELPLVVHLGQRPGPSTGVPTYTAQTDLNIAIYSGHGEFPRAVIAPGDVEEAYEKMFEALYLAEKIGSLSIILTDKHLLESGYCQKTKKPKIKIPERKEYAGKGLFKRSSYEHDEKWATTEEIEVVNKSVEKRIARIKELEEEASRFEQYKVYGEGNTVLIGWGSTKGAVLDAKLEGVKYIHLIYIDPLPDISKELEKAKKVIVIEQNATGQLAEYLQRKMCKKFENRVLKYDGRPFTPEEIRKRVK